MLFYGSQFWYKLITLHWGHGQIQNIDTVSVLKETTGKTFELSVFM